MNYSMTDPTHCWHHKTGRFMTNGDPAGQIFLFHPRTNNRFFFCSPFHILIFSRARDLTLIEVPEIPDYAEMQHNMMDITLI